MSGRCVRESGVPASGLTRAIGIFEQHNIKIEEKFKNFAAGLVCAFAPIVERH